MAWLALEDRILVTDELWGLVGVGLAPFLDWGGAWYADEGSRLGGDVGIALRLGPTRAVRGDVGEIALGYRFGAGFRPGSRWAVAVRKRPRPRPHARLRSSRRHRRRPLPAYRRKASSRGRGLRPPGWTLRRTALRGASFRGVTCPRATWRRPGGSSSIG